MIPALFLLTQQMRGNDTEAFLAYQDVIFAVKRRGFWTTPGTSTSLPTGRLEVSGLGLSSVKSRSEAVVGGWQTDGNYWFLACEEFDHVILWRGEPHYPRRLKSVVDERGVLQKKARKLLSRHSVTAGQFRSLQLFRVGLESDGRDEILAQLDFVSGQHHYGAVFVTPADSTDDSYDEIEFVAGGWPRVLSVADLNNDGEMEFIVGGPSDTGRSIALWSYKNRTPRMLASYKRLE